MLTKLCCRFGDCAAWLEFAALMIICQLNHLLYVRILVLLLQLAALHHISYLSSPFDFTSLPVIFSTKFKRFCGFQISVGGIFCVPALVIQSKFNGDNLCVKKLGLWSNMQDKLSIMVFILDGQVIAQSYVVKTRPTRIEKKKIHQVCCLQNLLRHRMLKIAFKFFYCRLYWHDEWVKTRSYPIQS